MGRGSLQRTVGTRKRWAPTLFKEGEEDGVIDSQPGLPGNETLRDTASLFWGACPTQQEASEHCSPGSGLVVRSAAAST